MRRIVVAGIGTEVGKTVVSAVLVKLLRADYWKPIQCGGEESSDTERMKEWFRRTEQIIYPPAYSLQTPVSPHQAAMLEQTCIDVQSIVPPVSQRSLVIEGAGGVLVPLTTESLMIDVMTRWNCQWVLVSRHYLGSINHTLLTIEALVRRQVPLLGIVFNGEPNLSSESAILGISGLPLLGRLLPEKKIDQQIIQRYANQWQPQIIKCLQ